jgi:hypothetical protein
MEVKRAIMAFSQSEKIKAGLIWVAQCLELLSGLPEVERKGGIRAIRALLGMVAHETALAKQVVETEDWDEAESFLSRAITMIDSGVGEDAIPHVSKALSHITNIGQQSMALLRSEGLI